MSTADAKLAADERAPAAGPSASGRWFTTFLVLATVGLSVLVVMLTRENQRLKGMLAAVQEAQYPPDSIKVGDAVLPMQLIAADGAERTETFKSDRGEQTLVFMVGGHCPYCIETLPRWNDVLAALQGAGVRVICIQSDAKAPAEMMALPAHLPGYIAKEPMASWVRHIPVEPAALLINAKGEVRKTWYGTPTAAQLRELADAVLDPSK